MKDNNNEKLNNSNPPINTKDSSDKGVKGLASDIKDGINIGNNYGLGNNRSYNNNNGRLNNLARNMDAASNGLNKVSNDLNKMNNMQHQLNNLKNKPNQPENNNETSSDNNNDKSTKLDKASDKVGGASKKLSGLNDKIQMAQMANNLNKIRKDPSQAKEKAIEMAKDAVKKKVMIWAAGAFIGCLPVIIAITVFIVILVVIIAIVSDSNGTSGSNSYSFDSDCNYENTMVTVMDGSNTNILATVSLEDYIIGVTCVEIGACDGASKSINAEYVKTQYVAAKTFLLGTKGYNSSDKTLTIRASTRDQQWCDLETGCILSEEGNYHNSYPGNYDKSKIKGRIYQTRQFTKDDLEIFHKYYQETYGDLFLKTSYNNSISKLGSGDAVYYKNSTQLFWQYAAKKNHKYEQILRYTSSPANIGYNRTVADTSSYSNKSLYKLGNYCQGTSTGNLETLENYPDVMTTNKIEKNIEKVLNSSQLNELNNYIETSINSAGYGTGPAVAAAGQSLIYKLYQYNYHLPYYFGGGHPNIANGVDKRWGNKVSPDSRGRVVYSYDCSGFVSWAIKNACKSDFSPLSTSEYITSKYGKRISLKEATPGDLMVKNNNGSGHIRLILKNNSDGSVITAESTSGWGGGIQFRKYESAGDYTIKDMDGWYNSNCYKNR